MTETYTPDDSDETAAGEEVADSHAADVDAGYDDTSDSPTIREVDAADDGR